MDLKKKAFLEAYRKAFGNISKACKATNMDRGTFYDWKVKDPDFIAALEAIEPDEDFADFVEDALVEKIRDKDTTAIIFACKTKLKKRGYVERQELTGADGKKLFEVKIVDDSI
jgi:hypothetical protein